MHFRKSKRALWIFTPSEMRLQRVKKTKFLKNELGGKLWTHHSPSRLAAAHFISFTLWGGMYLCNPPPSNKQLESIQSRVRASDFFKIRIVKLVSGIFEKFQGSNAYFSEGKIWVRFVFALLKINAHAILKASLERSPAPRFGACQPT